MSDWYVSSGEGAPVGPVSQELVVEGIVAGRVPVSARVCLVGGNDWLPLSAVPDFAAAVRQVAPPPPPPPSGPAVNEENPEGGDVSDAGVAQPADTTALFPNFCKHPIPCPSCGKKALRPRMRTRDFRCQACSRIFAGREIEQKAEEARVEDGSRAEKAKRHAEEFLQVLEAEHEEERRATDARCDIAQVVLTIMARYVPREYTSLETRDSNYAAARRVDELTMVADPVAAAQGATRMVPKDEWVQKNQSLVKLFTEARNLFIAYNEEHLEPGSASRLTLPAEGDPTGARRVFRSAIEQSLSREKLFRNDRGIGPAMHWLKRVFETRQAPEPDEYRTESDVSYGERLKSDSSRRRCGRQPVRDAAGEKDVHGGAEGPWSLVCAGRAAGRRISSHWRGGQTIGHDWDIEGRCEGSKVGVGASQSSWSASSPPEDGSCAPRFGARNPNRPRRRLRQRHHRQCRSQ